VKNPHNIIVAPLISEKSVRLSYGDPTIRDEKDLIRKYTFFVSTDANKIEIKRAIEEIYNTGKKESEKITVEKVHTIKVLGKGRRVRLKTSSNPKLGYRPNRKKAIITLAKGQVLEDYGV
jgi:large subunit ribosomal protein L23